MFLNKNLHAPKQQGFLKLWAFPLPIGHFDKTHIHQGGDPPQSADQKVDGVSPPMFGGLGRGANDQTKTTESWSLY